MGVIFRAWEEGSNSTNLRSHKDPEAFRGKYTDVCSLL